MGERELEIIMISDWPVGHPPTCGVSLSIEGGVLSLRPPSPGVRAVDFHLLNCAGPGYGHRGPSCRSPRLPSLVGKHSRVSEFHYVLDTGLGGTFTRSGRLGLGPEKAAVGWKRRRRGGRDSIWVGGGGEQGCGRQASSPRRGWHFPEDMARCGVPTLHEGGTGSAQGQRDAGVLGDQ